MDIAQTAASPWSVSQFDRSATQGVIVFNTGEGEKVASVERLTEEGDGEAENGGE